jgi:hypothetical protein
MLSRQRPVICLRWRSFPVCNATTDDNMGPHGGDYWSPFARSGVAEARTTVFARPRLAVRAGHEARRLTVERTRIIYVLGAAPCPKN